MQITCKSCNERFTADIDQERFVEESRAKGMKLLMLNCNRCGLTFPFRFEAQNGPAASEANYRCPTAACAGYAVRISDVTDFEYGCGECGVVWATQADLDRSIRQAT